MREKYLEVISYLERLRFKFQFELNEALKILDATINNIKKIRL